MTNVLLYTEDHRYMVIAITTSMVTLGSMDPDVAMGMDMDTDMDTGTEELDLKSILEDPMVTDQVSASVWNTDPYTMYPESS